MDKQFYRLLFCIFSRYKGKGKSIYVVFALDNWKPYEHRKERRSWSAEPEPPRSQFSRPKTEQVCKAYLCCLSIICN